MKKALMMVAVLAMGTTVFAQTTPTGGWTQTWDFTTGIPAGWTANGGWAGGWSSAGARFYDGQYATFDLNSLPGYAASTFGGNAGSTRFLIEVKIKSGVNIPNGDNYIQGQGFVVGRNGDMKGPGMAGSNAGNHGVTAVDKSWSGNGQRQSWVQQDTTTVAPAANYVTMLLDYGYSNPGVLGTETANTFLAWTKGAVGSSYPDAWRTHTAKVVQINPDNFHNLQIGGPGNTVDAAWGWADIASVKIAFVPEPTSLILLAIGGLALIRRR